MKNMLREIIQQSSPSAEEMEKNPTSISEPDSRVAMERIVELPENGSRIPTEEIEAENKEIDGEIKTQLKDRFEKSIEMLRDVFNSIKLSDAIYEKLIQEWKEDSGKALAHVISLGAKIDMYFGELDPMGKYFGGYSIEITGSKSFYVEAAGSEKKLVIGEATIDDKNTAELELNKIILESQREEWAGRNGFDSLVIDSKATVQLASGGQTMMNYFFAHLDDFVAKINITAEEIPQYGILIRGKDLELSLGKAGDKKIISVGFDKIIDAPGVTGNNAQALIGAAKSPEGFEALQTVEIDPAAELANARDAYAKASAEYLKNNKKEGLNIGGNISAVEMARSVYDETLKKYAETIKQNEIKNSKKDFNELSPEEKIELNKKIFKECIINEEKLLNDLKIRDLPIKEQSWWKKAWISYARMPRWKKAVISAAVGTGVAWGAGAAAGAGLLYYAGRRVVSPFISAGAGGAASLGFETIDKTIGKKDTKEYKQNELIKEKSGDISKDLGNIRLEYKNILEKDADREKKRAYWKLAFSMLAGAGVSALTSELVHQVPGSAVASHSVDDAPQKIIVVSPAEGVEKPDPFELHPDVAHVAPVSAVPHIEKIPIPRPPVHPVEPTAVVEADRATNPNISIEDTKTVDLSMNTTRAIPSAENIAEIKPEVMSENPNLTPEAHTFPDTGITSKGIFENNTGATQAENVSGNFPIPKIDDSIATKTVHDIMSPHAEIPKISSQVDFENKFDPHQLDLRIDSPSASRTIHDIMSPKTQIEPPHTSLSSGAPESLSGNPTAINDTVTPPDIHAATSSIGSENHISTEAITINENPAFVEATKKSINEWSGHEVNQGEKIISSIHMNSLSSREQIEIVELAARKVGDAHPGLDMLSPDAAQEQLRDYLVAYPEAQKLGFSSYEGYASVKDIDIIKFLKEMPDDDQVASALRHSFWNRGAQIDVLKNGQWEKVPLGGEHVMLGKTITKAIIEDDLKISGTVGEFLAAHHAEMEPFIPEIAKDLIKILKPIAER